MKYVAVWGSCSFGLWRAVAFVACAGLMLVFVLDQADGALSYAAVLRVGLWPTTPPLCRYAKCTIDLILEAWLAVYRPGRQHFSGAVGAPLSV
jgi:hypothetical protein